MPGLPPEHVTFLAKAYGLKSAADYETGASAIVSAAEAEQAIAAAERMLADVRTVAAGELP